MGHKWDPDTIWHRTAEKEAREDKWCQKGRTRGGQVVPEKEDKRRTQEGKQIIVGALRMEVSMVHRHQLHTHVPLYNGSVDISCQGTPQPRLFEFQSSCLKELKTLLIVSAKFVFKPFAEIIAKWDQASDLPSSQL